MDPLTVAVASAIALAGVETGRRWRGRAHQAEAQAAALRDELLAERHAACHDPLTGLRNRRAFYQAGSAAINSPSHNPLVVVVIDLDDFKCVNDEYGHLVGDEVLMTVARRFAAYAGDDLVARLGGDEFVGLLTSPTQDERWRHLAARRLADVLAAPMAVAGRSLIITASVGLAPVRQAGGLAEAVRRADAAMYRDKARSRQHRPDRSWPQSLIDSSRELRPAKVGC